MLQRVAILVAGLATTASIGFAGAGMASAAAPALKIKPGAIWTFEVKGAACEQDTFDTSLHTFVSDLYNDSGTWSGGGSTISMAWTTGGDSDVTFSGHFVSTTTPVEYKGPLGGIAHAGMSGKVVKGAVATFDGYAC